MPAGVLITATDLNQAMIDRAMAKPGVADITWQQADGMELPFPDESFDLIVCQFGVMFFPDKQASFREASRVLQHGGTHLFAVWNDWKKMPNAPLAIAADVVAEMLGCDPSSLVNPPYHHEDTIRVDLCAAGFRRVDIQRITPSAEAASAQEAAVATVDGSLIRTAIEAADPERLEEATDAVEQACERSLAESRSLAPRMHWRSQRKSLWHDLNAPGGTRMVVASRRRSHDVRPLYQQDNARGRRAARHTG